MIIQQCNGENFGSYKDIVLDLSNRGLTLISGPTGSGKSTLCDVVPWVLFGKTAKNGPVDDIISWNSGERTCAIIKLLLNDKEISIYRIRSEDSRINDLKLRVNGVNKRGKDLSETQKLINHELGIDAEGYLAATYFCEYSYANSFFTSTSKARKTILDQIVNTGNIDQIIDNTKEYKKELKAANTKNNALLEAANDWYNKLAVDIIKSEEHQLQWEIKNTSKIKELHAKSASFDKDKHATLYKLEAELLQNKIEIENDIESLGKKISSITIENKESILTKLDTISEVCETCGNNKNSSEKLILTRKLNEIDKKQQELNNLNIALSAAHQRLRNADSSSSPLRRLINEEKAKENNYLTKIEELKKATNPHEGILKSISLEVFNTENRIEELKKSTVETNNIIQDLDVLLVLLQKFKVQLLLNTVNFISYRSNQLLSDYFDAELQLSLEIEELDKINVIVYINGHKCNTTQLSKGQKQLLKLCFGVAVMESVSNNFGIKFPILFFDEALDGMDHVIKTKVFTMLNSISKNYSSIFVVEHSNEFKAMFDSVINVAINNGVSVINE